MASKTASTSAKRTTAAARSPRTRKAGAQDAIALLKADHREVERLFKAFEKAGSAAHKSKRKLVDQMIAELSRHAAIEEEVLYPAARDEVAAAVGEGAMAIRLAYERIRSDHVGAM